MKVILVNGSPHEKGCTYTALKEVASALEQEGIETDIFWIGTKAIAGCIACHGCAKTGRCVFHDKVNEFLELAPVYDGYIFWFACALGCSRRSDNFFYGQSFLYCRLFRSENFLSEAGGRGGICPPCGNDGSL